MSEFVVASQDFGWGVVEVMSDGSLFEYDPDTKTRAPYSGADRSVVLWLAGELADAMLWKGL